MGVSSYYMSPESKAKRIRAPRTPCTLAKAIATASSVESSLEVRVRLDGKCMRWCIQSTKEGERDPLPNVDVLLFVEASDVRSMSLAGILGML